MNANVQTVEVVIPVYDEERALGPNVELLLGYLRSEFPFPFRVVVADHVDLQGGLVSLVRAAPRPAARQPSTTVPARQRRLQALVDARGGGALLAQLGRFSLVGVSNTAISFVVFAALRWADTPAPAAAALGFIAGALNGYWWNGRWTFAGGGRRRSLVRYGVVQGAGAGLSARLVAVGHVGRAWLRSSRSSASMVVVTSTTFVANRSWAFAKVAGSDSQGNPSSEG